MNRSCGMFVAGSLGCAAAGMSACSIYSPPRIEVESVAVMQQSAEGLVVTFQMKAENRNAEPLPLRDVKYSLSLGGKEVFRGKRSAEATIRRYGTQEFTLPIAVPLGAGSSLAQAPGGEVAYGFRGSVEYELPGSIAEVLFDTGLRRTSAGFSEEGRLDFSGTTPTP